jgi:hypothetical protein
MCELLVCADLLKRGHDPYRAVNHFCEADVIAWVNGAALRIEVRATVISGRTRPAATAKLIGRADVLATVDPDGVIMYTPPLPDAEKKIRVHRQHELSKRAGRTR